MTSFFGRWNIKKDSTTQETLIVWSALTIVVLFFYNRILSGYFITDDYAYLTHLLGNSIFYSQGEQLKQWFFDYNGRVFLRPVVQWIWLTDFIAWNREAAGYYLTNIILHSLNACLVYSLSRQISQSRFAALAGGFLFALHPIHADSVAWITDRVDLLCTFSALMSTVYYVLFRTSSKWLYFWISLSALTLATLTKESAITLPIILLVYDILFLFPRMRWQIVRAQLGLITFLLLYFGLRILIFQGLGGYSETGFLSFGLGLFLQYYTTALGQPFIANLDDIKLLLIFCVLVVALMLLRKCKGMWFGLAWVILALVPAGAAGYVAPRLSYLPSVGFTIATGAGLAYVFPRSERHIRQVGWILLGILLVAYGAGLNLQVDSWSAAGQITASVQRELLEKFPVFPSGSKVHFIGIPRQVHGLDPYAGNFPFAIRAIYHPVMNFELTYGDNFPIVSEKLEQNFFLEFRQKKIVERSDVRQSLINRNLCLSATTPKLEWDFAQGTQDWEAWNQIADYENRDGLVTFQSTGNDPYLASPLINISTMEIDDIEIVMSAQSQQINSQGNIFWLVEGQDDFSPARQQSFHAIADGKFHTYRINLAETGALGFSQQIVRLRLDPISAPAQVKLKSIRVFSHCTGVANHRCICQQ